MADTTTPTPVCCGQGGSWAPKPGQPLALGCQLCPRSATYWNPEGKPPANCVDLPDPPARRR